MSFSTILISWYHQQTLDYPWMGESDPYKIWLSEILLQQTRSDQALSYYQHFIDTYPTVYDLAATAEDRLMRLWQGLGYYSRARNLHQAAKDIVELHHGELPTTMEELRKLPGIGPYTAAAIASFAYGERVAVVDGNVYRVLARHEAITIPINTSAAHRAFYARAMTLMGAADPADFNQALMMFGASVCKPQSPLCHECPLSEDCQAYQEDRVGAFPMKKPKAPRRHRFFHQIILKHGENVWVKKRLSKDIWQGLYTFYTVETDHLDPMTTSAITAHLTKDIAPVDIRLEATSAPMKQILTHQVIHSIFYHVQMSEEMARSQDEAMVSMKNLRTLAFPKTITQYLNTFAL